MFPLLNLRTPLVCLLIYSLCITGLLNTTTPQSQASNNSLTHSLTPGVKESSEEAVPEAETVDEATRARVAEAYGKLPLSFEENRGQVDKEVKYISRGAVYTLFLTPTEALLTLQRSGGKKPTTTPDARRSHVRAQPSSLRMSVLRMKLSGANLSPAVTGENKMGARTNYFIGNDPEKWQTDVARYERVRYSQVYPGIDMIYYGQQQQLEYDFEVAPGVDARRIALEFTGVKQVKIERKTGDLLLKTAGGEVRQRKPVAYQEVGGARREVASRYVMKGKSKAGIEVGEYDRTQRLVIDPVLSYSTYLGGSGDDYGADTCQGIAFDAAGNAYVTGGTSSTSFPVKNQYQTFQANGDVFVTKLNTNASGAASLLYSTYLGGGGGDFSNSIAVDSAGNAYVTGFTGGDFPTLNQYSNQGSAFVTKLDTNASGAASLLYSTRLGSGLNSTGTGIAVDTSGHAYVTGQTGPGFPVLHQYQTYQGRIDAFVTKLDTNASGAASLLYSTHLGGSLQDSAKGIAVDSAGNAYVTGYTASTNFPTLNHYRRNLGHYDAFVTKLNLNASGAASLLYSTYLGGSNGEYGSSIAVDSAGHAYVTGYTDSTDFPVLDQYQTDQGDRDAFVTKLDLNASGAASLLYSTYLGGSLEDLGSSIAVDSAGNAYVAGYTASTDFPKFHQYQAAQKSYDAFVTKLTDSYSITGRITRASTMNGINAVTLTLTSPTPAGFPARTARTNSLGYYTFMKLPAGRNYTIRPTKTGFTFSPVKRIITNLRSNIPAGASTNFTGSGP